MTSSKAAKPSMAWWPSKSAKNASGGPRSTATRAVRAAKSTTASDGRYRDRSAALGSSSWLEPRLLAPKRSTTARHVSVDGPES